MEKWFEAGATLEAVSVGNSLGKAWWQVGVGQKQREKWMDCVTLGKLLSFSEPNFVSFKFSLSCLMN